MKNIYAVMLFFIFSCSNENKNVDAGGDLQLVKDLHEAYRTNWLLNDSAKVVNLFSDNGMIVPPGYSGNPIIGHQAIGAWWFTVNADTTYPITDFQYLRDTVNVIVDWAFGEGVSSVSWNTQVKDSVISSHQSSSNFFTLYKKEGKDWKIFRQIWNQRK